MKTFKFIVNGRYVHNKEINIDKNCTLNEFKESINASAHGYHCDFDSVAFASQEECDEVPTIIFENLLYTGHNCFDDVFCVKNDDGDVIGYTIQDIDDGVLYDTEDSALKILTFHDYSGEIADAFNIMKNSI